MKSIHIYIIMVFALFFTACETDLLKTTISDGTAPLLNSSASTIVLTQADSANVALVLDWTNPNYLDDTSNGNVIGTYVVEIGKTNAFALPKAFAMVNKYQKSFSVFEFNKILLAMGCEANMENQVFVRVKSVFFSADTLISNMLSLSITPYSTVIPPAISVPQEVWISGEALTTGWNAPFLPEQQFTKESATSFSITINLLGGKNYEMITDGNGANWTPCYRIAPNADPSTMVWGGDFVWDGEGSDYSWSTKLFMAPPNDGRYKIILDFQEATFTVIDVSGPPAIEVPAELWISGDALTTGWNSPFLPEQQFTKISDTKFSITIALQASLDYEMITDGNGSNWTPCYRIDPALKPADMIWGGTFVWDGEGSDYSWGSKKFLSPSDAGTFNITMDFQTATFTVTEE